MEVHDFHHINTLTTLLTETLMRADGEAAFVLNPGEPGFLETLKGISAEVASTVPGVGRKPVVSHANHVLYGLELSNRALKGDDAVYQMADWSVAWKLETVSEDEWQNLLGRLEEQSRLVIELVEQPREWEAIMHTGTFAIAAHAAYHLGAVRQVLRQLAQ
jgi:hypothetical protein